MKRLCGVSMVAGALVVLAGCGLYRYDRQYVWDTEYNKVRNLYDQCGSVDVVEQILRERKWTQGQINEVRYRLSQDYYLDEDGLPRGLDREPPVVPRRAPVALGVGSGLDER